MIKNILVVYIVVLALFMASCGQTKTQAPDSQMPESSDEQTSESEESVEPADVPGISEEQEEAPEGMQLIGGEYYGFVTVPENWGRFVDAGGSPTDNAIQFTDKTGVNIITMRYWETSDSTPTPEELLYGMAAYMESIGGVDITGAVTQLNGIDALQVYAYFPYDNTVMVVWGFNDSDGRLREVIAEGWAAMIVEIVGFLESSYTL